MISTHVLDTTTGRPAVGVSVLLEAIDPFTVLGSGVTDVDGRVGELGPALGRPGNYRLIFEASAYFAKNGRTCFFPQVIVAFTVTDPASHLHVPLLLSPFSYSTYRGS
ncbi:5-hydroxyisourate hydrolase [Kribbella amoyensis]|uniref:5-hydroxyisourate hydrolase n=1 Tax=Kribbella amoyensis TaxID=996641 RepID=A0A561B2P9_9ACTN|nr:hydroxyisourate hydrolase [Kribbella amoyensis]TWD73139.1 5-hydroxyisourate hydrolase [Kribbella amoyensis]